MDRNKRNILRKTLYLLLISTLVLGLAASTAQPAVAKYAAVIMVTSLDDSGPGTLRQAIADAPSGSIIYFQEGLTGKITLTNDRITIDKNLIIQGPGPDVIQISGGNQVYHFEIRRNAKVTINALALIEGKAINYVGGSIWNEGNLTLNYVVLAMNKAVTMGGAIYNNTTGVMSINNCWIAQNETAGMYEIIGAGGGVWNDGVMTIYRTKIEGNSADLAGGGVYNNEHGKMLITDSEISSNYVPAQYGYVGGGGGVYNYSNGEVTLLRTRVLNNQALATFSSGGGVYSAPNSFLTLDEVIVSNNYSIGTGGGVDATGYIKINRTGIAMNTAYGPFGDGGGLEVAGELTLTNSTIRDNIAHNDGGGIDKVLGPATMTNVTISGNVAYGNGGGIFSYAQPFDITNVTVTLNKADGDEDGVGTGGGIYVVNQPHPDLPPEKTKPVMSDASNRVDSSELPSYTNIQNSILAMNTDMSGVANDCFTYVSETREATLTTLGYNLIKDVSACKMDGDPTGDIYDTDPMLGPLKDNGGPTRTHAPALTSPAIDTGSNAVCPETDQRGAPRPADGDGDGDAICDIGAFEGILGTSDWKPFANPQYVITPEDTPVTIYLTGADPEDDPLTFSIATGPAHGSLTETDDPKVVIYTPDHDYFGMDSFIFQVTEEDGDSSQATVTIEVTPVADDLGIMKFDSEDPILAGSNLVYTLVVVNYGPSTAYDVTVQDTLPSGVTFLAVSNPACTHDSGVITCALGNMTMATQRIVQIAVQVNVDTAGVIENTATVNPTADDPDLSDNTAVQTTEVLPYKYVSGNDCYTFEGAVGSEWSATNTSKTPDGKNIILGEFSNGPVTLTLNGLPSHSQVEVTFDLYVLRSWDGNQVYELAPPSNGPFTPGRVVGPDIWMFGADGNPLLVTSFTNWNNLGYRQSFPGWFNTNPALRSSNRAGAGSMEFRKLGYQFYDVKLLDSRYAMRFVGPHFANSLALTFGAQNLQNIEDESWGIDNVCVRLTAGYDPYPSKLYLPVSMGK